MANFLLTILLLHLLALLIPAAPSKTLVSNLYPQLNETQEAKSPEPGQRSTTPGNQRMSNLSFVESIPIDFSGARNQYDDRRKNFDGYDAVDQKTFRTKRQTSLDKCPTLWDIVVDKMLNKLRSLLPSPVHDSIRDFFKQNPLVELFKNIISFIANLFATNSQPGSTPIPDNYVPPKTPPNESVKQILEELVRTMQAKENTKPLK